MIPAILVLAAFSCGSQKGTGQAGQGSPEFDAASAYGFVKKQVEFGPRVPGTPAHEACAEWFVQTLRKWTPDIVVQEFKAKAFDGRPLEGKNIVASFNRDAKDRILLCAHWDSRPFADHDLDPANHFRPVMGANDGASGAGVLLEVARCLSLKRPALGVDILLLDLEDFGEHRNWRGNSPDSWGLGSQHWAKNPHRPGYAARFGILLDMVGAPGAVFPKEGTSMSFAPAVVEKVWQAARGLGLSEYFVDATSGELIDDHLYINQYARIPTADVIDYDDGRPTGFPGSWHTVGDTLDKIDRNTLAAVGRTVLAVIYGEK
jgi:Zn-dependent M28 family amino/carboxypeptidase